MMQKISFIFIIISIFIVLYAINDFLRNVNINNDLELREKLKKVKKRMLLAICIFIVPIALNLVVDLFINVSDLFINEDEKIVKIDNNYLDSNYIWNEDKNYYENIDEDNDNIVELVNIDDAIDNNVKVNDKKENQVEEVIDVSDDLLEDSIDDKKILDDIDNTNINDEVISNDSIISSYVVNDENNDVINDNKKVDVVNNSNSRIITNNKNNTTNNNSSKNTKNTNNSNNNSKNNNTNITNDSSNNSNSSNNNSVNNNSKNINTTNNNVNNSTNIINNKNNNSTNNVSDYKKEIQVNEELIKEEEKVVEDNKIIYNSNNVIINNTNELIVNNQPVVKKIDSFTYYNQCDSVWQTRGFCSSGYSMCNNGCGATALAMVASTLGNNKNVTPLDVRDYLCSNKLHGNGGMAYEPFTNNGLLNYYGLVGNVFINYNDSSKWDDTKALAIKAEVDKGNGVILLIPGHYVVLGKNNQCSVNQVYMYDPASRNDSGCYTMGELWAKTWNRKNRCYNQKKCGWRMAWSYIGFEE